VALADRTLAEVVELLAAREPAPGGGSAAALTAAIAAALTEMAAAFSLTSNDAGDDAPMIASRRRASELRTRLLELAEEDMRSYAPVIEALALDRSDSGRPARLRDALSAAAEVPLAIATAAAEVSELAAAATKAGNAHLQGDAAAAALLAEASARAAARLVELNLAGSPEDERLDRAAALAARAWAGRTAALG
jgi:formiminotetrahydrofolate cyclodeaminase